MYEHVYERHYVRHYYPVTVLSVQSYVSEKLQVYRRFRLAWDSAVRAQAPPRPRGQ